jgi:phosphatidylserine decarboxylase
MIPHQYVDRESGAVVTERLFSDPLIRLLYSEVREIAPLAFKAITGRRFSSILGFLSYESVTSAKITGSHTFLAQSGIDFTECLEQAHTYVTLSGVFERKIRYWETRPFPQSDLPIAVCPADSRALVGSLRSTSSLMLKGKFFDFEELLGRDKRRWLNEFHDGDFAIFRLTPEKYHYNHCPVSGRVVDFYEIMGSYHSCNPTAVIQLMTPYSKNTRTVTIIDTDVQEGSRVGLVAFIEVTAMMIGKINQCYSEYRYGTPKGMERGLLVKQGQPKSLFRPGSSTTVVLFQHRKVRFAQDIVKNMHHPGASSRFSSCFGKPLVETDVKVRSLLAESVA